MKLLSIAVITASLLTFTWGQTPVHAQNAKSVELYVATNGNDKWSGQLATPNKARTDGPFATVQRARDQLRALKEKNALSGGARVLVRGGVYNLKDTLQFAHARFRHGWRADCLPELSQRETGVQWRHAHQRSGKW
jgi:hypothetical protein